MEAEDIVREWMGRAKAAEARAAELEAALNRLKGAIAWSAKGDAAFDPDGLLDVAASWKMEAEHRQATIDRREARSAELEAAADALAATLRRIAHDYALDGGEWEAHDAALAKYDALKGDEAK